MAKRSVIERNNKRKSLSSAAKEKRLKLKRIVKFGSYEEKVVAMSKLDKMPRDMSASRVRHRCFLCGRGRGNYRRFGICRICLRNATMSGLVPGLSKSSW